MRYKLHLRYFACCQTMNDIYEIEFYFAYNFKYVHLHIDILNIYSLL